MKHAYSKYILIRSTKDEDSPAPSTLFFPIQSASDAWENHKNWLNIWGNKIDIQCFGVVVYKHSGDVLHISVTPSELLELAIEDLKVKVTNANQKIEELTTLNDSK